MHCATSMNVMNNIFQSIRGSIYILQELTNSIHFAYEVQDRNSNECFSYKTANIMKPNNEYNKQALVTTT